MSGDAHDENRQKKDNPSIASRSHGNASSRKKSSEKKTKHTLLQPLTAMEDFMVRLFLFWYDGGWGGDT